MRGAGITLRFMESFLHAFIPLFVAIDPVGTLPLFLGLTDGFTEKERRRLAVDAVLTAFVTGVAFGFAGHYVFSFVGITTSDFRVAGGLLLLIFSTREISGHSPRMTAGAAQDSFIGVAPLGIPVIAGPAMITTILILHDIHPFGTILAALAANLAIALMFLRNADRIINRVGEAASKVTAKVVAIFLAAIGVMMIRRGLEQMIGR
jgi:multiple antibiotic resistance protein